MGWLRKCHFYSRALDTVICKNMLILYIENCSRIDRSRETCRLGDRSNIIQAMWGWMGRKWIIPWLFLTQSRLTSTRKIGSTTWNWCVTNDLCFMAPAVFSIYFLSSPSADFKIIWDFLIQIPWQCLMTYYSLPIISKVKRSTWKLQDDLKAVRVHWHTITLAERWGLCLTTVIFDVEM